VSGVLQTGDYFAADRYTYLACLPFALIAAGLLLHGQRPVAAGLAAAVVLAALGILSWRPAGIWKNSLTLWDQALRVDPENYLAYYQRGTALLGLGRPSDALGDFDRSLSFNGAYPLSYMNRGTARLDLGDLRGAIADYDRCLE